MRRQSQICDKASSEKSQEKAKMPRSGCCLSRANQEIGSISTIEFPDKSWAF